MAVNYTSFLPLVFLAGYLLFKHVRNRPLRKIRGPPSSSWLIGNTLEIRHQTEVGELEFKWYDEYGTIFRTKGCYGQDVLFVADPKALQYILHTANYHFPKPALSISATKKLFGNAIVANNGSMHARHRKIMNPGFSAQQLRTFLDIFQTTGGRLTKHLKGELKSATDGTVNMAREMSKATLDVIGEAGFAYEFGSLNGGEKSELAKSLDNIFLDSFFQPTRGRMLYDALWSHLPNWVLNLLDAFPTREKVRFASFRKLTEGLGRDWLREQVAAGPSQTSKDILSILARANESEDSNKKLAEDEILSAITTLLFAGHETTGSTMTWMLYELSKHPETQTRIRDEIAELRASHGAKRHLTSSEYDSLTYTNAAIKEILRLHPIVPNIIRGSGREDVLPLAEPLLTADGETISHLPIPKNQEIWISIAAYNRLKSVWGEDSEEWNPSRWLESDGKKKVTLGMFANLMTFSAGTQGCIGWRFAVQEVQSLLVEMIENFEFSIPPGGLNVKPVPVGVVVPLLKDEMEKGAQMPLRLKPLTQ